jgi:ferric-dicitrate binding protein FerR (iron transport regulator)
MSVDLKLVGEQGPEEELLTRGLAQMSETTSGDEFPAEQREHGARVIAATMAKERSRGIQIRSTLGGLAVAAAAAMAFVNLAPTNEAKRAHLVSADGAVEVRFPGADTWQAVNSGAALDDGAQPGAQTELRTADSSRALFAVDDSITVEMKATSQISWRGDDSQQVVLGRGSASFKVAKLSPGESFVVKAGGTSVTVHGTEFSVTLLEEQAAPCVIVLEGLVEVKGPSGTVWVSAGQEAGCDMPTEAKAGPETEESPVRKPVPKKVAKVRPQKKQESKGSLAEQNQLFQRALIAERTGKKAQARKHLDDFLARYPDSPLAAQVRSQRASLNQSK